MSWELCWVMNRPSSLTTGTNSPSLPCFYIKEAIFGDWFLSEKDVRDNFLTGKSKVVLALIQALLSLAYPFPPKWFLCLLLFFLLFCNFFCLTSFYDLKRYLSIYLFYCPTRNLTTKFPLTLSLYILIYVGSLVFTAVLKILLRSLFQIIKVKKIFLTDRSIERTHVLSNSNVDHICFSCF